jgi:TatD DNase family protein
MFVDSHAHLDDRRFDGDRDEVIAELSEHNIAYIVNFGSDLTTSLKAQELARRNERVCFGAGFHPHEARFADTASLKAIERLLADEKCVALGEIGLDYHYDHSPRDIQRDVFARQIVLAQQHDKPICVHMREATKDTIDILKAASPYEKTGVIHSFSGSRESAQIFLDMGFYLSISGPVTFQNAGRLREVVSYIPLERLLIETDCPYLTPAPHRGKRNEPKYVRYVAEKIAEIKQIDVRIVAQATMVNTGIVYGIFDKQMK